MAITSTAGLKFKEQLFAEGHDFSSDSFKAILMDSAFAFQPATHNFYTTVSGSEIATGNGYTQDTKTLTSVTITTNATTKKAVITCDNPTWTATGGNIATTGSMIVYNDTNASNTVVLCVDYGSDYAPADGTNFAIDFSDGLIGG